VTSDEILNEVIEAIGTIWEDGFSEYTYQLMANSLSE
jgi:hypothetical protein